MCGIAGLVGNFIEGLAARMNALQKHRGLDSQGIFEDPNAQVCLSHVRLSIIDLSAAAHQPMYSPDGRFVLIFNGEIYNFKDLRNELIKTDLVSTGDTEVLLYGLIEFGVSFIERLNGIFAFALWDRYERELLLSRDQLGVKPLYYTEPKPDTLLFASEIKALYAYPGLERQPDFLTLQEHLAYCHASGERTALKGIRRLLPGHYLCWRAATRKIQISRYWRPSFQTVYPLRREQAVTDLRRRIRNATHRQMIADVPLGALLSGGLDSSFVTAMAARQAPDEFNCYTIVYPETDNRLDRVDLDLPHARRLARALGLSLREIELTPLVAELWPRLIYHLDEPVADPAAIASFLICQSARDNGTKVLLSGQGGDELFCGYPRYRVMNAMGWVHRYFPWILRRAIGRLANRLPAAREGSAGAGMRRIRRALLGLEGSFEQHFLDLCANTPHHEIHKILSPTFQENLHGSMFQDICLRHMQREHLQGLQRLRERDLSIYLPNHNLLYTDKMGMAAGVEVRVPLLDMEIVDSVLGYPDEWLLARGNTKVLFRDAAQGVVPDIIVDRIKTGFGAPLRKWLRYDLEALWNEVTSERAIKRRGWFNYSAVQEARRRSQTGKDDLYMLQWAILTIELWARQFIDCNPGQLTIKSTL